MTPVTVNATVLSRQAIATGAVEMVLEVGEGLDITFGQFAQVHSPAQGVLLPRPISVADYVGDKLTLIIQPKGEGTQALCKMKAGDSTKVLLPLGKTFELPDTAREVWLVGGGLGVAPLYYAARRWAGQGRTVRTFAGYRGAEFAYYQEQFSAFGGLDIATDDGGLGTKGYVHELVLAAMAQGEPDAVVSCGPTPMIRALQGAMAGFPHIPAWVSMEQRMACGYGVCRVCVCKTKSGAYPRVCADGPVFPLAEVEV